MPKFRAIAPQFLIKTLCLSSVAFTALLLACPVFAQEASLEPPRFTDDMPVSSPSALVLPPVNLTAGFSKDIIVSQPAPASAVENPLKTEGDKEAVTTITIPLSNTYGSGAAPLPDLAKPKPDIEIIPLQPIDADAQGLLSLNNGGFATNIWQDTVRALVERLLPELHLPTASPTLNVLARRLLLTAAQPPVGPSTTTQSLLTLRVNALLELGNPADAWGLARLVKQDRIDESSLRRSTEAFLLSDMPKACEQMNAIMAGHADALWQKLLVICQLKANDTKAAQLSVDLMRDQPTKDDIFLSLIDKNIFKTSSQLPRQLTPLEPSTLMLLKQTDLPLPNEIFNHADALLFSSLLQAKPQEENTKIAWAEKAALRGLITANDLGQIYKSAAVAPSVLSDAATSSETGARLHAILFQAISAEADSLKRATLLDHFVRSLDPTAINGPMGVLLAEAARSIPVHADLSRYAVTLAKIFASSNNSELANAWFKLANDTAPQSADVAEQLSLQWPYFVLSALVSDVDYRNQFSKWIDASLKNADRNKRDQVSSSLMILKAAGYIIPEETWGRVIDVASESKRLAQPSALLIDRLRDAGTANRKGEAILLSLLLAGNAINETPLFVMTDTIRTLRLIGLSAEAEALSREAISPYLGQTTTASIPAPVANTLSPPSTLSVHSLPATP